MPTDRNTPVRLALLGALALLGTPGCQHDHNDRAIHGETFPDDSEPRAVDRFVQVQSSAAARTDATLTSHHFDGGHGLNSLGEQKLDLMLRDDDRQSPLVVYLDFPRGAADRDREAVRAYLIDHGANEGQIEFRNGPNLDYSHPAEDGLRGLRRLEGDTTPSEAPTDTVPPTGNPTADLMKGAAH